MEPSTSTTVTKLLLKWSKGDKGALDEMLPLVYDELRRLAAHYINRERSDHTLQPTALVHEAYMRLVDQRNVDWKNKAQFFGVAAQMMRRILINYARDRAAAKRGADVQRVSLSMALEAFEQPDVNLLALDDALKELTKLDERKSQIVELKFFGGLTIEEIAEVLQVSHATVEREWAMARAWLYRAMGRSK